MSLAWRVLLVVLVAASPSRAYLRENHQLTVREALLAVRSARSEEAVAGLCAQLADESAELSAVESYRRLMRHPVDYVQWIARGRGPAETVGRVVTVQQLLHGLTGGWPEGVREVARGVIGDMDVAASHARSPDAKADAWCALGFAYHLYGDSFAHERIHNPSKMYPVGLGHLFDSSMPDLPLYSPERFMLWQSYLLSAAGLQTGVSSQELVSVMAGAKTEQESAREANGFNEDSLHGLLTRDIEHHPSARRLAPFDPDLWRKGCQAMLDRQSGMDAIAPAPDCERAWALFRDAAIRRFDEYDRDPAHPRKSRDPASLRTPYFRGSLFSKGVDW